VRGTAKLSPKWPCLALLGAAALVVACPARCADDWESEGTLYTAGSEWFFASDLADMVLGYIPADNCQSRLIILSQCRGGDSFEAMNARAQAAGDTSLAILSGTSPGENATYGGWDKGALYGLYPGATADSIMASGNAVKKATETPMSNGRPFTLTPMRAGGPVKSRHVLVYAGAPEPEDNADLQIVKEAFGHESQTEVTSVGGFGTDGWGAMATKANLESALNAIAQKMNPSEQFILIVLDHGGMGCRRKSTIRVSGGRMRLPPLSPPAEIVGDVTSTTENDDGTGISLKFPASGPVNPLTLPPGQVGVMVGTQAFGGSSTWHVDLNGDGLVQINEYYYMFFPIPEAALIPQADPVPEIDLSVVNYGTTEFEIESVDMLLGALPKRPGPTSATPPPAVSDGPEPPPEGSRTKGGTSGVPAVQVQFTPESDVLVRLLRGELLFTGKGVAGDLNVEILADRNADGQRDAADTWLASANASMEAPAFTVPLLLSATAGQPVNLLCTVDVPTQPSATAAAGMRVALAPMVALACVLTVGRRRGRARTWVAAVCLVCVVCLLVPACGGGANGGGGGTADPTMQLNITAIVAEDQATGATIEFTGLPADGSVIAVER